MKIKRFEDIEAWHLSAVAQAGVNWLEKFIIYSGSGLESYKIGIEPLFHQFNLEP